MCARHYIQLKKGLKFGLKRDYHSFWCARTHKAFARQRPRIAGSCVCLRCGARLTEVQEVAQPVLPRIRHVGSTGRLHVLRRTAFLSAELLAKSEPRAEHSLTTMITNVTIDEPANAAGESSSAQLGRQKGEMRTMASDALRRLDVVARTHHLHAQRLVVLGRA